jgi:hypothetical protein
MTTLSRLLGDSPGRVLLRLVFLSFVVGVVLAALGLEPADLLRNLVEFVRGIWNLGFGRSSARGSTSCSAPWW